MRLPSIAMHEGAIVGLALSFLVLLIVQAPITWIICVVAACKVLITGWLVRQDRKCADSPSDGVPERRAEKTQ